jgi:hypothetical protein
MGRITDRAVSCERVGVGMISSLGGGRSNTTNKNPNSFPLVPPVPLLLPTPDLLLLNHYASLTDYGCEIMTVGIRATLVLDLAPKKKKPPQIEKRMMEEFEKMGKQGARIEELLKQLLDEAASNRSSLTKMEESMRELKMVADGSLKWIEEMEKRVEATPPPPPPPLIGSYPPPSRKAGTRKSPPTTEKLLDLMAGGNHLRMVTRNRGNGEGIHGILPRPPECGATHSTLATPTFCSDPLFGKYFKPPDHTQPSHNYPTHKHLPKLDFPKFNGENPKI